MSILASRIAFRLKQNRDPGLVTGRHVKSIPQIRCVTTARAVYQTGILRQYRGTESQYKGQLLEHTASSKSEGYGTVARVEIGSFAGDT